MNEKSSSSSELNSKQIRWAWIILIVALASITMAFISKYFLSPKKLPTKPLPVYRTVPSFKFTERSGKIFESKELDGKIWIADFIFTRCAGPCPLMTSAMSKLQQSLKLSDDIRLVSFSVDPEYDTPEVLNEYVRYFSPKPDLWFFLTGDKQGIQNLVSENFKLPLEKGKDPSENVSTSILHSTYFVLLDGKGRIRGYYDSSNSEVLGQLLVDAHRLLKIQRTLPNLNAILNSMSTILLIAAYRAVRRKRYQLHKKLMYAALCTSTAFLVSYLTYHFGVQLTKHYDGPFHSFYIALLLSHTLLAIGVLPLVLITVAYALKAQKRDPTLAAGTQFKGHARIARWTFPIWLYVSFTGVIVYLMLYQLPRFLER